MNNAIEVRNVHKSLNMFSLKDISFDVPKGFITGFIGPNGAGKTTTIWCMLDMTDYESGSISILGVDRKDESTSVNVDIGIVMDSPLFVQDWTVNDVESAVSHFYPQWDAVQFGLYLAQFSIDRKKKVKELSRGMKVKLMLAVALSHNAKLLVLDEPTSGLDPSARDEICDLLGEFILDEERSVLFSTHITSDLEKIADYIVFILDGRIIFSGLKEELMEKFVCVKGGLNELSRELRKIVIGCKEHGTGFEGMAEVSDLIFLPKNALIEPITLDEIIVFMNREAKNNE